MTEDPSRSNGPPESPPAVGPGPGWADVLISFRWPLAILALAVVAFLVYVETLRRVDRVGDALGAAADRAGAMAKGLLSGDVTESFISSIPEIASTGGGNLELATLIATETFTRSDERRVLWDVVSLGTTVSEIKVPVTYRYHLRLDDPWRLEISDHTCVVWAPEIRPTQPPAIHTEGMEKRVEESWLRFDGDDQLTALEKSITARLRVFAESPRRVALVREQSRRTVAEFVRTWLLLQGQWRADRARAIQVIFPDETQDPSGLEPTIRIERG